MNPFKYGQVVKKSDFCLRPELEKPLKEFILSNQNIHVTGERRTGKTSLIIETVRKLKTPMLHIDFFQIKSISDIYKRVLDGIVLLNLSNNLLTGLMRSINELRPSMTFDQLTGTPSITITSSQNIMPENIPGLFDFINKKFKKKKLVIFLDEFQDIMDLKDKDKILAILRSRIQLHSKTTYIFAGSIRKKMVDIFNNPESPFFKSAIPINVETINDEMFTSYIQSKFKLGKREISREIIREIFSLTNEIPGDVQELCNALWEATKANSNIVKKDLNNAFKIIFSREQRYYENVINITTKTQLEFLKGLAEFNGENIYSKQFSEYTGIYQVAAITRAVNRLLKLKIIYSNNKSYRFASPFFKLWLLFTKK